jgi:hypothetical protein
MKKKETMEWSTRLRNLTITLSVMVRNPQMLTAAIVFLLLMGCLSFPANASQVVLSPVLYGGYCSSESGYHAYGLVGYDTPIYGLKQPSGGNIEYYSPLAFSVFDLSGFNLDQVQSIRLDVSLTTTLSFEGSDSIGSVGFGAGIVRDGQLQLPGNNIHGPTSSGTFVQQTDTGFWTFTHAGSISNFTQEPTQPFVYYIGTDGLVEFWLGQVGYTCGPPSSDIQYLWESVEIHYANLTVEYIPEPATPSLLILGGLPLLRRRKA